ncbi:MAG: LysR family transcriptional regulator [Gemmatimonadaceae bacterium]
MRLDVRDLRLVATIAELGNLTRASEQLNLTQSALSHQLADLERRIGAPVFERSGRRMIPTRVGRHLSASAAPTLARLRHLEHDLAQLATGREGELRIATECYTCYHWLPPVLKSFHTQHPAIDVRVMAEATADPFAALADGSLDLAIGWSKLRSSRFKVVPLFHDELMLVVSSAHRLAERDVVRPAELRGERFLVYSPPETNFAFQQVFAPAGISPRQLSVLQLTEAIVELVKANLGITFLAGWAVEPYLESKKLRAVRIAHPGVRRVWQAVHRAVGVEGESAALADFVTFLKGSVRAPPRQDPEFAVLRSAGRLARKRTADGGR